MIRVYSANFTRDEMLLISHVLRNGCQYPFGSGPCYKCENVKVCLALNKAADYCERKAYKMVER